MVLTARPDGVLEIVATGPDLRALIATCEEAINDGEAEMVMLEDEGVGTLNVTCTDAS